MLRKRYPAPGFVFDRYNPVSHVVTWLIFIASVVLIVVSLAGAVHCWRNIL